VIISFETVIKSFISSYGIRPIVLKTKFIGESECEISLRGGFSTNVKVIEDKLYKDDVLYCKVEDLF